MFSHRHLLSTRNLGLSRRSAAVLFGLAALQLCVMPAASQTADPIETKIVSQINTGLLDATTRLIEQTVNTPSPTQDIEGVKKVGAQFRSSLEALGFKTRWIDMPPAMKRAGHLEAELDGGSGKRILLLGHLDTVLSGEGYRREGNRAFGTGTNDMKAGNAVIIAALQALKRAGALDGKCIIVHLTGDEESSGKPHSISRADMLAAAKRSDYALSFETAIGNTATIGRRGSSSWSLEVTGQTGHSSGIFGSRLGAGAIFEASRILNSFYESLRSETGLTFNPSLIVGGSSEVEVSGATGKATGKTNVVPDRVLVRGDLRFLSEDQKQSARAKMQAIVEKSLPKTSAKITFEDGIPAMQPTEGNRSLLKALNRVSLDLKLGEITAYDPTQRGAGDIAFVSHLLPSLDGLGIGGGNAHAPGEWADLGDLERQIKRAALLIHRLAKGL